MRMKCASCRGEIPMNWELVGEACSWESRNGFGHLLVLQMGNGVVLGVDSGGQMRMKCASCRGRFK